MNFFALKIPLGYERDCKGTTFFLPTKFFFNFF